MFTIYEGIFSLCFIFSKKCTVLYINRLNGPKNLFQSLLISSNSGIKSTNLQRILGNETMNVFLVACKDETSKTLVNILEVSSLIRFYIFYESLMQRVKRIGGKLSKLERLSKLFIYSQVSKLLSSSSPMTKTFMRRFWKVSSPGKLTSETN